MNRLLRPDMNLGNEAQNKKFTVNDKASLDRHAHVSTFYLQQKPGPGAYKNTPEYSTGQFSQRSYDQVKPVSSLGDARSSLTDRKYDTPSARVSVDLRDEHRTAASADSAFAGNRPFLEKGKSQKALNRKNKPMSIDDIRELLNKNK